MDTTSSTTPNGADEVRRRQLRKLNDDFGPAVLNALADAKTVEVLLNADGRIWQERLGEPMREVGRMDARQAEAVLRTVAATLKTTVTREKRDMRHNEHSGGNRLRTRARAVLYLTRRARSRCPARSYKSPVTA